MLRALAASFPDALGEPELARLASRLGADVPFFLAPRPARVGGIGERIAPLADFAPLALPAREPRTSPLHRRRLRGLRRPPDPVAAGPSTPSWASTSANDLEPAAERLCPAIAPLRERLRAQGARAVGLSGSGPTVFGIFPDAAEAARALARAGLRPAGLGPGRAGAESWVV